MEIRHIECFKYVADYGSTMRAAEYLYTSQSSVSKNIAMLEEELGQRLFERSNRGLSLTPHGRELYELASNILHDLALFRAVKNEPAPQFLRVASYPSKMISHYLCVLYNELLEEAAQEGKSARYNYVFLEGSISEVADFVEKGMADIGFVYFASSQMKAFRHILGHKELVYEELDTFEPCIYVGPKNPLYEREGITFEELQGCKFIQSTKDYFSIEHHLHSISLGMAKAGSFHNVVTTNSDNLLIEMLLYTDICNFSINLLKDATASTPYAPCASRTLANAFRLAAYAGASSSLAANTSVFSNFCARSFSGKGNQGTENLGLSRKSDTFLSGRGQEARFVRMASCQARDWASEPSGKAGASRVLCTLANCHLPGCNPSEVWTGKVRSLAPLCITQPKLFSRRRYEKTAHNPFAGCGSDSWSGRQCRGHRVQGQGHLDFHV